MSKKQFLIWATKLIIQFITEICSQICSFITKLTKIHKILRFKQNDWMKVYIDLKPRKERRLPITVLKNFFIFMINAFYAKTMENFKTNENEKDNLSHTSKRTYISRRIFHKSYAAIHEIKPVLILKKSIYVGFIVLE